MYKNMQRGIVALVFRCQIIDGQLRPTNEAAEVRWMTPPEINLEMDDAYACRLLDALNTHPPMIRAHDGVDLLNPAPPSTP
jgi:8-oxo-dGTP diphosphatase